MNRSQSIDNSPGHVREGSDFDVEAIRRDFPVLDQLVNNKPLVYLDNAATTQKPRAVIDAVSRYYAQDNANVHRGVHQLSVRATDIYEGARQAAQKFIGAERVEEIIFVRGATEAINLVAQTFGRSRIETGDEIIISHMEHHSNIVPWQILCEQTGAKLRVIPINDQGELEFDALRDMLGPRTKMVAVVHVSNALGTINPVEEIIAAAHQRGVPVLIDGAQATAHLKVDVRQLDCDFYTLSGHKLLGPTGIGVLYGKYRHLEAMPPYQSGGDMIESVTLEKTTYNTPPYKFEAGTPNIAGAAGLRAATEYISGIGLEQIGRHEQDVLQYAADALSAVDGIRFIGEARQRASVLSFVIDGVHPHDIGTILDREGVAIRAGHHCAQPVMERFDLAATARASFSLYNTHSDVEALVEGVRRVIEVFA